MLYRALLREARRFPVPQNRAKSANSNQKKKKKNGRNFQKKKK
jgi:hypothetical protein